MKALFRGYLLVVLMVTLLLIAIPSVALAAPLAQEEIPTLPNVFELLAQGIGVGAVLAFLFERFAWFDGLTSDTRWWVIFGFSLGLPLLARLVLQFVPPEVLAVIDPYWHALAAGFLTWAASQGAHMLQKSSEARSFMIIE